MIKHIWDDGLIRTAEGYGLLSPKISNGGKLIQFYTNAAITMNDLEDIENDLNITFVVDINSSIFIFRINK